jgi:hypothetical protein
MVRRDFLKMMAVGGTALALGAEPVQFDHLLPPPGPPEDRLPGIAYWFATSCRECPPAALIADDRRAVHKVEEPLHPITGQDPHCGAPSCKGCMTLIAATPQHTDGGEPETSWRALLPRSAGGSPHCAAAALPFSRSADRQPGRTDARCHALTPIACRSGNLNYEALRAATASPSAAGIPHYHLD